MSEKINFPRIVSLSTVGILKHYHQDYLLHPVRTDFVGSNGVGKSIIADLFQLMFITDRDLIEFGTDGLNRKLRKIESLPYKCNEGFVFINIEVVENQFITFGTCIPSRSVPLKQFLILSGYDTSQNVKDLCYAREKFLTYKDFLNSDGTISSIQELNKNLRDSKNVYLNIYTFKEHKLELYDWLFRNEILPINLSITENLKAFAKVIQSFSKAKTLKIEKSESLKEFLFDDAEKENYRKFDELKGELSRLLLEYHNLTYDIKDIELKQITLNKLKQYQVDRDNAALKFEKSNLIFLYYAVLNSTQEHVKFKRQLEKAIKERDTVLTRLEELEMLIDEKRIEVMVADDTLSNLNEFRFQNSRLEGILENLSNKETEIANKRNGIANDEILKGDKEKELKTFSVDGITNAIEELEFKRSESDKLVGKLVNYSPVFEKYGNAEEIELKYHEQQIEFEKYKTDIQGRIEEHRQVIAILSGTNKNSLFYWAVENSKQFNLSQESILFHLIDVLKAKPADFSKTIRYATNPQSLFVDSYEDDHENGGLWLRLGALTEFVKYREDIRLFENPEEIKDLLELKSEELNKHISSLDSILDELLKIKRGEEYDSSLITGYDFDQSLMDYSVVSDIIGCQYLINEKEKHFKENSKINDEYRNKIADRAVLISNNDRLASEVAILRAAIDEANSVVTRLYNDLIRLKTERAAIETAFLAAKVKLTGLDLTVMDSLIEQTKGRKVAVQEQREKLIQENTTLAERKSTILSQITQHEANCEEQQKAIAHAKETFEEKQNKFTESFSEEVVVFEFEQPIEATTLQELHETKIERDNKFRLFYEELPDKFQETRSRANQGLNEQIDHKIYSFRVIEEILLGGKIGHLDEVTPYLTQANEQRVNIGRIIYETMLKIFSSTREQYESYEILVKDLNSFFAGKKISNSYYFNIAFEPKVRFNISWIDSLYAKGRNQSKLEELFYNKDGNVESFLTDFFQKEVRGVKITGISELLNPKSYFDLSVSLTDENKKAIPGSTGETYSAVTLLGIGRLSKVQNVDRKGIRFMILEETASLDNTNFNTFPDIASEFNYQLITMTPKPFGAEADHGWFVHHLIKGKDNKDINYPTPASYYKTNKTRQDLTTYLSTKQR